MMVETGKLPHMLFSDNFQIGYDFWSLHALVENLTQELSCFFLFFVVVILIFFIAYGGKWESFRIKGNYFLYQRLQTLYPFKELLHIIFTIWIRQNLVCIKYANVICDLSPTLTSNGQNLYFKNRQKLLHTSRYFASHEIV